MYVKMQNSHEIWLWWLLGTSVRESDGCALDCFIFLGAVACTDQRMQEHFSCLPDTAKARCSSSHSAEVDRKAPSSMIRTWRRLERALLRQFYFCAVEIRPLFGLRGVTHLTLEPR